MVIHCLTICGEYYIVHVIYGTQRTQCCAYKHYLNRHYMDVRRKGNANETFLKTVISVQRYIHVLPTPNVSSRLLVRIQHVPSLAFVKVLFTDIVFSHKWHFVCMNAMQVCVQVRKKRLAKIKQKIVLFDGRSTKLKDFTVTRMILLNSFAGMETIWKRELSTCLIPDSWFRLK